MRDRESILLNGKNILDLTFAERTHLHAQIQLVFGDSAEGRVCVLDGRSYITFPEGDAKDVLAMDPVHIPFQKARPPTASPCESLPASRLKCLVLTCFCILHAVVSR